MASDTAGVVRCACNAVIPPKRVAFLWENEKRTACISCQEKIDLAEKEALKSVPSHRRPVPANLISALGECSEDGAFSKAHAY